MAKPLDITGERYGRLVALRRTERKQLRNYIWEFQCDCGNVIQAVSGDVRRGKTLSCGCLQKEKSSERMKKISHLGAEAVVTHGKTNTPEFIIWTNMIQRCENPNHNSYKDYGGRGIVVCKRWRESFDAFLCDMGTRPVKGMQIDRADNDGNYEPGNCRWVEPTVNANNRRTSKKITFNERTMTISEWAREIGISPKTLANRLKSGWSIEEALTMKVNHGNRWKRR